MSPFVGKHDDADSGLEADAPQPDNQHRPRLIELGMVEQLVT